jgi:hypothetical protein
MRNGYNILTENSEGKGQFWRGLYIRKDGKELMRLLAGFMWLRLVSSDGLVMNLS